MKKLLSMLCIISFLCGCSTSKKEDIKKHFSDKLSESSSYSLVGTMKIISDEEVFNYTLDVSYLKDNNYKVKLINTSNNHEQIILRNEDGVYVITPSLNKSYKFDSSWPSNSSQSYLLHSILKDMNTDDKIKLSNTKDGYVIKVKVNYPNNDNLTYEKIYFNKDKDIKRVEVYDKNDEKRIETIFEKIDYKPSLSTNDFKIDEYIKEIESNNKDKCENETCDEKTSNILDDIIYPLYLPGNTYLTSSEKIDTDQGKRVILTFKGDKSFTIVEEALNIPQEFEINPVIGNPVFINDTLAVMEDTSLRWNKGNISYYLTSNYLTKTEMSEIAASLSEAKSVLGSK